MIFLYPHDIVGNIILRVYKKNHIQSNLSFYDSICNVAILSVELDYKQAINYIQWLRFVTR